MNTDLLVVAGIVLFISVLVVRYFFRVALLFLIAGIATLYAGLSSGDLADIFSGSTSDAPGAASEKMAGRREHYLLKKAKAAVAAKTEHYLLKKQKGGASAEKSEGASLSLLSTSAEDPRPDAGVKQELAAEQRRTQREVAAWQADHLFSNVAPQQRSFKTDFPYFMHHI